VAKRTVAQTPRIAKRLRARSFKKGILQQKALRNFSLPSDRPPLHRPLKRSVFPGAELLNKLLRSEWNFRYGMENRRREIIRYSFSRYGMENRRREIILLAYTLYLPAVSLVFLRLFNKWSLNRQVHFARYLRV